MKQTILVTGGCGYIGSHTCTELLNSGYDVIIVDNLSNSSPEIVNKIESLTNKSVTFFDIDCARDIESLIHVFNEHEISSVIHFAAYKSVAESVSNPLNYYSNNINSLLNVLVCMNAFSVKNIVFSSSATVYGETSQIPVTENMPHGYTPSPYGKTKQMCEQILVDAATVHKLNAISLRYFNPIGAHPSGCIGELPNGIPNNLLPYITQTAIGIRNVLSVFGNNYDTQDGTAERDYVDVVDLAKAHVKSIQKLHMCCNDDTQMIDEFNIGTGKSTSVLELIKLFEDVTGVSVNYKITDRRPGDIAKMYADVSKANTILGWIAETPTAESLANSWRWQQNCS